MKASSKIISVFLAAALCGSLASCSGTGAASPSSAGTSQEAPASQADAQEELPFVTLKVLFPGDEPEDGKKVYVDWLTEKTTEDGLNCCMDIEYIPWADLATKYSLKLSSGTAYDIIHTNGADYFREARNGAFREITMEEIQTYMPETYKNEPEDAWKVSTVDGKMYFIPWYGGTVDGYGVAAIRQDLVEKFNLEEVTDIESFEQYLAGIKENIPSAIPMAGLQDWTNNSFMGAFLLQANGWLKTTEDFFAIGSDGNGDLDYDNVIEVFKTEEFAALCQKIRDWQVAGYIEKNASSSDTTGGDKYAAGAAYVTFGNLGGLTNYANTLKSVDSTAVTKLVDLTPEATKWASGYTGNGYCIGANSENPERAMMLLDKLKNDREYHDTTYIGIEGVHWTPYEDETGAIDDTYYVPTEEASKFPKFGTAHWGWYNKLWARYGTGDSKDYVELDTAFESSAKIAKTADFTFDQTPVEAAYTACTSVLDQYGTILMAGMSDDVEGTIAEMNQRLEEAGYEDVKAAFLEQYNTYMDTYFG